MKAKTLLLLPILAFLIYISFLLLPYADDSDRKPADFARTLFLGCRSEEHETVLGLPAQSGLTKIEHLVKNFIRVWIGIHVQMQYADGPVCIETLFREGA